MLKTIFSPSVEFIETPAFKLVTGIVAFGFIAIAIQGVSLVL